MSPVVEQNYERNIKSIGNCITTIRDLVNNDDVKSVIYILSESVGERLREVNMKGRTVQLMMRNTDLEILERQATLPEMTFLTSEIAKKAMEIFIDSWTWEKNLRSMGVRVTKLYIADTFKQISFYDESKRESLEKLDGTIDNIRSRFGYYSIGRAIISNQKEFTLNPAKSNIGMPNFFK
jgi:DNA polymerase-4